MGQTVNLLAYAFGGSNPSLPTSAAQHIMCWTADFFVAILKHQRMELQYMGVTSSDVTMSAENNVPAHFEPRVLSAGLVMIKGEVALTSPS